jgi:hypothetical protein
MRKMLVTCTVINVLVLTVRLNHSINYAAFLQLFFLLVVLISFVRTTITRTTFTNGVPIDFG